MNLLELQVLAVVSRMTSDDPSAIINPPASGAARPASAPHPSPATESALKTAIGQRNIQ
jgi:hypothetical protein